ncbi:MAG TPA: AAA family ATPase [Rhodocyclaceae bacterium]|nr:AAA family ATPase [Rhodocyclaceae bacterium]
MGAETHLHRLGTGVGAETRLVRTIGANCPPPLRPVLLEAEMALALRLDADWALRPILIETSAGERRLLLEDPGADPLDAVWSSISTLSERLQIAAAITNSVGRMHRRGVVHRNLKPQNIFIGAARTAWLTGFGLSTLGSAPASTEFVSGTLPYIAPEQTGRLSRPIDPRSDLYSLGIVLFELFTGRLPFQANDTLGWIHCHIAEAPSVPPDSDHCPAQIGHILVRLLRKAPEERYQTAAGLEADLRACQDALARTGAITLFPIGERDTPDKLARPGGLFGRRSATTELEAAWRRVHASGASELVLVSGTAGIGKSALLHKFRMSALQDGVTAAGKCNVQTQTVPYAVLTQALKRIVGRALSLPPERADVWRDRLRQALGANGKLMAGMMPGLENLVGPLAESAELSPLEAKNRFELLFADLLAAAASVDGPLLLVLDDLQWVDRPSAALLERVLSGRHVKHLLIAGTYRSDEVDSHHDLHRLARATRTAGSQTTDVRLLPLNVGDLTAWLSDAISMEPHAVAALTEVVFRKTGGVPLAVARFLATLIEEELVIYSEATGAWTVDIAAAQALAFTDNLLSVMLNATRALPASTQQVLQRLACLGGRYPLPGLADLLETDAASLTIDLQPAVDEGLVVLRKGETRFVHDRIREAAYALVAPDERSALHLSLARGLARLDDPDLLFKTVLQFNRAGCDAVRDKDERHRVADLNLAAACRSMEAMGHAAADGFLAHGLAFLGAQGRMERPDLVFAFAMRQAECRVLTGDHAGAESLLLQLSDTANDLLALATVCRLQAELFTMVGSFDDAVAVGIEYLRRAGFDCPRDPSLDDVAAEARELMRRTSGRPIEALADLPLTTDRAHAATMELITCVLPAALYTCRNLHSLLVLQMANRTLQRGRTPESPIAFIMLSRVLGPSFLDYDTGFRFGRLGYDMIEADGTDAMRPIGRLCFAVFCNSWMNPIGESAAILHQAIAAARVCGNQTYTTYGHNNLFSNHIVSGTWLAEAQRVAEDGLAFSRASKFLLGEVILRVQSGFAAALRGETPHLTTLLESEAAEDELHQMLETTQCFELPLGWYWIRKLQACVIAGDPAGAIAARARAQPLVWASEEFLEEAEFHLYGGLALAQGARAGLLTRSEACEVLHLHVRKLRIWSGTCPSTFACRANLLSAEHASLAGEDGAAQRLYEEALASARASAFPNMQALIAEAAWRHHAEQGLHTAAEAYRVIAREAYAQWGASGKVDSLNAATRSTTTALHTDEHMVQASWRSMDLSSVLRASQALSREIFVDDITRTLLRIVLEHAGGDRALLILCRDGELRPLAEARKASGNVSVETGDQLQMHVAYPETVGLFVHRTRETMVLSDPHLGADSLSQDAYIRTHRPRSALAIPLLKQGELIGVLYVENTLVSDVFTPSAIAMLDLLAPQVAISLENARLYADLLAEVEERKKAESALRENEAMLTLGQTISQTASWRWNIASGRATWSAQLYAIMGLDPAGPAPKADDVLLRVHPDERAETLAAHSKAVAEGRSFSLEYRVLLADGTIKHLLGIGQPDPLSAGADYVGVVMDMTERRQMDEALRETQAKLAHAGRLTTMGQLTASIAHEVNQPLAAMVANGSACVRWLDPERTNLERARETARRIVADGHRAAGIIDSIRSMARNNLPARDPVDVNTALRDVVVLLAGEARKRTVRLDTLFAPGLPPVLGDRTQLQQVFVNLVMNGLEAMESEVGERRLLVRTDAEQETHLVISFEDNGPGIDPTVAPNVFQPFFTTKADGMGMGLAICQSIATAHDGTLTVDPADSGGTVFRLRLPTASVE